MPKTKVRFYVISCSSDGMINQRYLYIHGELGTGALPSKLKEARERVFKCFGKNKCNQCDAEVHVCHITRDRKTLKQEVNSKEDKYGRSETNECDSGA